MSHTSLNLLHSTKYILMDGHIEKASPPMYRVQHRDFNKLDYLYAYSSHTHVKDPSQVFFIDEKFKLIWYLTNNINGSMIYQQFGMHTVFCEKKLISAGTFPWLAISVYAKVGGQTT